MTASTFTFSNDNRYYNPLCDSELLYQDENGDTDRIFCLQSSCIAPIFTETGVPLLCDTVLKPAGYTTRKFEFGADDAAWTLNANYAGFTYINNQFVAPFQIGESEPGQDCMVFQRVYNTAFQNGNQIYVTKAGAYFIGTPNSSLKKVVPAKDGFQPMSSQGLANTTIDAESVGSALLKPYLLNYPHYCTSAKSLLEMPQISYFDVGTRSVPASNTVTLKNASIAVSPVIIPFGDFWGGSQPYGATFGSNNSYIQCDAGGILNRTAGNQYPICCAQADGSAIIVNNSLMAQYYNSNSSSSNTFCKILWENQNGVATNSRTVITGYRIQKYVQKRHQISFSQGYPQILSGARDIEMKIYPLGYTISWEYVGATPTKSVIGNNFKYNYFSNPESYTVQPTAWGDVEIKFTYTPFDRTDVRYHEYGPMYASNPPGLDLRQEGAYNPPWGAMRLQSNINIAPWDYYINFLLSGGYTCGAGLGSTALITVASRLVSYGSGFGSQQYQDLDFGVSTTHKSNVVFNNDSMPNGTPTHPLSPQNLATVLKFEYPLADLRAMYLVTMINGRNFIPQPLQTSKPTSKAYLWRRLLGELNSLQSTSIDLTFSNRKQWFNGTCPFDLKYDNIDSDEEYHPSSCSSSIKPILWPTGI